MSKLYNQACALLETADRRNGRAHDTIAPREAPYWTPLRAAKWQDADKIARKAAAEAVDASAYVASKDTQYKEIEARMAHARDAIDFALHPDAIDFATGLLRDATDGPQIIRPLGAADALSALLGLTRPENDAMAVHLIQAGDMSRYGALNAVTRLAHDETIVHTYDRASDLEALGGRLLTITPREWSRIAEADAPDGQPRRRRAA